MVVIEVSKQKGGIRLNTKERRREIQEAGCGGTGIKIICFLPRIL